MNCLIIINGLSGNACKLDVEQIKNKHAADCDNVVIKLIDGNNLTYDTAGFDKVVVCGGDGTLYNALNNCQHSDVRELVYVACGTFNETFHTEHSDQNFLIGKLNDQSFSYVCACGSFCEIGYQTSVHKKKRLRVFAYLAEVFKYFKVHSIRAKIKVNGRTLVDNYTLVMLLHSQRCFGFNFNKLHAKHPEKLFLLTVKSDGCDNFVNRVRLFFKMFRIFFCGIRKKIHTQSIFFDTFDSAQIEFAQSQTMCVDGERLPNCNRLDVFLTKPSFNFSIDKECVTR